MPPDPLPGPATGVDVGVADTGGSDGGIVVIGCGAADAVGGGGAADFGRAPDAEGTADPDGGCGAAPPLLTIDPAQPILVPAESCTITIIIYDVGRSLGTRTSNDV